MTDPRLIRPDADEPDSPLSYHLLLAGVPLLPILVLAPAAIFFPLVSVSALAVSAFIALIAWHYAPIGDEDRLTLWNLSGACELIGIAAGVFSNAEPIIKLLVGT